MCSGKPHPPASAMPTIPYRALRIFAVSIGAVFAFAALWLGYYFLIANPCNPLFAQPETTCYHRVVFTGGQEWRWLMVSAALYFGCCVVLSWVSLNVASRKR